MDSIVSLKNVQNGFETEISVIGGDLSAEDIGLIYSETDKAEAEAISGYDGIHSLNKDIDRLTCNATIDDYAVSAMCGIVAGRINSAVSKAKKLGYGNIKKENENKSNETDLSLSILLGDAPPNASDTAVTELRNGNFLNDGTQKPLPDNRRKAEDTAFLLGNGENTFSDEILGDFTKSSGEEPEITGTKLSHSKTLLGLVMAVSEQFSNNPEFSCEDTASRQGLCVEINSFGHFVSREKKGKIFSGILNWFFYLAMDFGTDNTDFVGTSGAARPLTTLVALSRELSRLSCLKSEDFGKRLHTSFENFLAEGGSGAARLRADLSDTFDDTEENKKDILKGQRSSVIFNELLIRAVFFVKGFIAQMNEVPSLSLLNYCELMPYKDRTLSRMMSVSFGVFTAIDVTRAAIKSAARGGAASLPKFLLNMALKINIAGIGRFATEIKYDAEMLGEREELRDERIRLCGEQLALNSTKVFYKQAGMWIQAESAVKALTEASLAAKKAVAFYNEAINEMTKDISTSEAHLRDLVNDDKSLLGELDGILKYE